MANATKASRYLRTTGVRRQHVARPAVVAAETFSDLRTVVEERAPFFFTRRAVASALERAGRDGHFDVDAASPVAAAKRIQIPVFLIHGADDVETPPDHSRRIFTALTGPKRLEIVPGATHNRSLHGNIWLEIERWVSEAVGRTSRAGGAQRRAETSVTIP